MEVTVGVEVMLFYVEIATTGRFSTFDMTDTSMPSMVEMVPRTNLRVSKELTPT
jgi:hypothetical protein